MKSFTLKGEAGHKFFNRKYQGMSSPALYSRITCVIIARSMVAHSIHVAMILYVGILNARHHASGKIPLGVAVRSDGSVAGEGRIIGIPKFHSWSKCTMPLTNINSDWMSNASSGLCIIYTGPLSCILGIITCNINITVVLICSGV